jgi:act minimal PKS ketosynthase (KS/KS alpha)
VTDDLPLITGIGLWTVLGPSAGETWDAITTSGRCVSGHTRIPVGRDEGSRVATLAVNVARQALADAGWGRSQTGDSRTALVFGTSKGPIEDWIVSDVNRSVQFSPPTSDKPSCDVTRIDPHAWGLHATTDRVARATGIAHGPRLTVSAACATGLHALVRAAMMLRTGEADRVLVVAAEASVHPLFVHSFKRLGVLAPEGFGCRPFDESRSGFVMTEAAAAVCLERGTSGRRPYAAVGRYAIAGDAGHLTAGAPDGRVQRHVLARVVHGRPVDFVHAHGTGTVVNDPIELAAIDASVDPTVRDDDDRRRVPVYSHKAHLGHSLGAAGLVSVVLGCLTHRTNVIPPNVRTTSPLASRFLDIPTEVHERRVHRSVHLAAGFGGTVAAMSLVTA